MEKEKLLADFEIETLSKEFPESTYISKVEFSCKRLSDGTENTPKVLIDFKIGGCIEYSVGKDEYQRLISSDSVGKFWHSQVKGKWPEKIIKPLYSK